MIQSHPNEDEPELCPSCRNPTLMVEVAWWFAHDVEVCIGTDSVGYFSVDIQAFSCGRLTASGVRWEVEGRIRQCTTSDLCPTGYDDEQFMRLGWIDIDPCMPYVYRDAVSLTCTHCNQAVTNGGAWDALQRLIDLPPAPTDLHGEAPF